jgi:hypothetical protein
LAARYKQINQEDRSESKRQKERDKSLHEEFAAFYSAKLKVWTTLHPPEERYKKINLNALKPPVKPEKSE